VGLETQRGAKVNFKPHLLAKVLSGEKTQTRRIAKANETWADESCTAVVQSHNNRTRTKWSVDHTYAVAPGRSKHGQGFIELIALYLERAADISEADARAEGFETVADFLATWDTINGKGKRESAVWVLEFSVKHD